MMWTVSSGHDHANCQELLGQLSDYIDGELETSLCAEIEEHLSGCSDCRIMVDTMRKTIILYRDQAPVELPPDVKDRLYSVLKLE
jgi:predicted anti-sigma-YlaC factor YlaD